MSTERQLPGREVAKRLFAAEYEDSSYSYAESDEERAPNYVVGSTGVRINRLFCVGVVTEVAPAGESQLRARIADPTGTFVVYAGQYQPEAMAALESIETPAYVAVSGKANTFEPADGDRVYTSIRPEKITEVDAQTRERWIVSTAERTLSRIGTVHAAIESGLSGQELTHSLRESGVDPSFAAGIPIALEQYGTTQAYLADLQRLALEATRIVAEEIDEVETLMLTPSEGDGTFEPVIAGPSVSETSVTDIEMGSGGTVETDDEIPTETGSTDQESSVSDTNGHTESTEAVVDESERSASAGTDSNGFESDTVENDTDESDDFDPDEFDPDEFELDEEIREEVESEYGTEFSTAAEVDSPSESETEIESDASEFEAETETTDEEVDDVDRDTEVIESADREADHASEDADGSAVDLQAMLLDQMDELDDGSGANREALIDQVSEMAAVSEEAVQETIQDALSQGKCYEPGEASLARIDF